MKGTQAVGALVQIDSQALNVDGSELKLHPGMLITAEVHQGRRTVLEYLLSPAAKAFTEAAGER